MPLHILPLQVGSLGFSVQVKDISARRVLQHEPGLFRLIFYIFSIDLQPYDPAVLCNTKLILQEFKTHVIFIPGVFCSPLV